MITRHHLSRLSPRHLVSCFFVIGVLLTGVMTSLASANNVTVTIIPDFSENASNNSDTFDITSNPTLLIMSGDLSISNDTLTLPIKNIGKPVTKTTTLTLPVSLTFGEIYQPLTHTGTIQTPRGSNTTKTLTIPLKKIVKKQPRPTLTVRVDKISLTPSSTTPVAYVSVCTDSIAVTAGTTVRLSLTPSTQYNPITNKQISLPAIAPNSCTSLPLSLTPRTPDSNHAAAPPAPQLRIERVIPRLEGSKIGYTIRICDDNNRLADYASKSFVLTINVLGVQRKLNVTLPQKIIDNCTEVKG